MHMHAHAHSGMGILSPTSVMYTFPSFSTSGAHRTVPTSFGMQVVILVHVYNIKYLYKVTGIDHFVTYRRLM